MTKHDPAAYEGQRGEGREPGATSDRTIDSRSRPVMLILMKAEQSRAIAGYLSRVSRARKRGDSICLMAEKDKAIPKWPVG